MAKSTTRRRRSRAKPAPTPKATRAPKPKFRVYDRDGRQLGGDCSTVDAAKKRTDQVGATIQTISAPAKIWKRCPQYWRVDR